VRGGNVKEGGGAKKEGRVIVENGKGVEGVKRVSSRDGEIVIGNVVCSVGADGGEGSRGGGEG